MVEVAGKWPELVVAEAAAVAADDPKKPSDSSYKTVVAVAVAEGRQAGAAPPDYRKHTRSQSRRRVGYIAVYGIEVERVL